MRIDVCLFRRMSRGKHRVEGEFLSRCRSMSSRLTSCAPLQSSALFEITPTRKIHSMIMVFAFSIIDAISVGTYVVPGPFSKWVADFASVVPQHLLAHAHDQPQARPSDQSKPPRLEAKLPKFRSSHDEVKYQEISLERKRDRVDCVSPARSVARIVGVDPPFPQVVSSPRHSWIPQLLRSGSLLLFPNDP